MSMFYALKKFPVNSTLFRSSKSTLLQITKRNNGFFKDTLYIMPDKEEKRIVNSIQKGGKSKIQYIRKMNYGKEILRGIPKEYKDQMPKPEENDDDDPFYYDNLVETRIRAAIKAGEFENLPYSGQPLPDTYNFSSLTMDRAELTAFKILKNNNVCPEWVEINKEVHSTYKQAKNDLRRAFLKFILPEQSQTSVLTSNSSFLRNYFTRMLTLFRFGKRIQKPQKPGRTQYEREVEWKKSKEEFKSTILKINSKIQYYNVLVPMGIQKYFYDADLEMSEVMENTEQEIKEILQQHQHQYHQQETVASL